MSKRKSFEVGEVLPNDEQLGARAVTWRSFMDTYFAAFNQSAVVQCTQHMHAVAGRWCRYCFNMIMQSLLAFRRWLILRERKRKLEPPLETDEPSHDADSGEPQRKYNRPNESEDPNETKETNEIDEAKDILISQVCELLDYDVSDHSNASDVKTDAEVEENDLEMDFNREVVGNQLIEAVARRKSVWEKTGLLNMMMAIEDIPNIPSNLKVEKWLFNQNTGPFDLTENRETIVTKEDADGGRMKYSRKQEVIISRDIDDTDSLSTVDEKKYILQNKKDRNVTSKIKVIQTFRIQTSNAKAFAMQPSLHAIAGFPIHEDEPSTSADWPRKSKPSRSNSIFESNDEKLQTRLLRASNKAPSPTLPSKVDKRRRVFKKTVKKKSKPKSPSKKESFPNSTQQYESALQNCGTVRKVSARRIHWQESSLIADSSSDGSDKVLNTSCRSKVDASTSPQRVLRSKSSSITPEVSPRKLTSRRKVNSPRKAVDRELVGTFNSICLSPRIRPVNRQQGQPQSPTAQASDVENSNVTSMSSRTNANSTYGNITASFGNRSMIPDASQGIVVYKPKAIQPEAAVDARVRITSKDLELAKVLKPRHLNSFRKFDYLIHPNSSVLFFPSDSEDDEPLATQTTTTTTTNTEGDLSFDDDDPILTFKPRSTGRLNVMECRYH